MSMGWWLATCCMPTDGGAMDAGCRAPEHEATWLYQALVACVYSYYAYTLFCLSFLDSKVVLHYSHMFVAWWHPSLHFYIRKYVHTCTCMYLQLIVGMMDLLARHGKHHGSCQAMRYGRLRCQWHSRAGAGRLAWYCCHGAVATVNWARVVVDCAMLWWSRRGWQHRPVDKLAPRIDQTSVWVIRHHRGWQWLGTDQASTRVTRQETQKLHTLHTRTNVCRTTT